MAFRVCAPYVTVKIQDAASGKPTVIGFYEGGILPEASDPESVAALVAKGMVEQVDEQDPPGEAQAPEDPEEAEPLAPLEERVAEVQQAQRQADEDAKDAVNADADADDARADVGRPKDSAPKSEWVAYAVAHRGEGESETDAKADAEAKSKADLIAEYGG